MGADEFSKTRQQYHFNTAELSLNNTVAGLLGGYMPALRWYWPTPTSGLWLRFATPAGFCSRGMVGETRVLLSHHMHIPKHTSRVVTSLYLVVKRPLSFTGGAGHTEDTKQSTRASMFNNASEEEERSSGGGGASSDSWSGGYVEQLVFAVPNSTADHHVEVSAVQPTWFRYINVTADGTLRYVHYVR
jgi:hypothetical protein